MVFTNAGAQFAIWRMGSAITNYIQFFAIGSGSGTALVTNENLINESGARVAITGSPNFSTARKVTFLGDYASIEISGLKLTEFGLFDTSTQVTGSSWLRESFNSVTFDGTSELQLSATVEAIPG